MKEVRPRIPTPNPPNPKFPRLESKLTKDPFQGREGKEKKEKRNSPQNVFFPKLSSPRNRPHQTSVSGQVSLHILPKTVLISLRKPSQKFPLFATPRRYDQCEASLKFIESFTIEQEQDPSTAHSPHPATPPPNLNPCHLGFLYTSRT